MTTSSLEIGTLICRDAARLSVICYTQLQASQLVYLHVYFVLVNRSSDLRNGAPLRWFGGDLRKPIKQAGQS